MSEPGDANAPLSPEDERLIRVLEQSNALPESVRAALIERVLSASVIDRDEVSSSDQGASRPLLKRLLSQRPSALFESVTQRVDDYRAERVDQVRAELRKLVDRVDLQGEVQRLLSQISIDVTLSIRLVPKEGATLGMTPKVETKAKLNIRPSEEPPRREDSEEP